MAATQFYNLCLDNGMQSDLAVHFSHLLGYPADGWESLLAHLLAATPIEALNTGLRGWNIDSVPACLCKQSLATKELKSVTT